MDDAISNAEYGIFIEDTLDTTQKYGYFITSKQYSSQVEDIWQKVYTVYEKLKTTTDKIILKYRTEEDEATEATISWVTTNSILSSDDLSNYERGDEIQVIQGSGSGKTAHISSITEAGGIYSILLDDTFPGASGTSKVLFSKWKKLGEFDSTNPKQWKALTLRDENHSPYVQIKVCMQFTGKNSVRKIRIVSNTNTDK